MPVAPDFQYLSTVVRKFAGNRNMSHHFDTRIAREDPSLNLCDFYLFEGGAEKTVMIMTVNPDAGLSASDIFHREGLYAFRFDLNGDAREELAFKIRFEPAKHQDGDEHVHVQRLEVREMYGAEAVSGFSGKVLIDGETGAIHSKDGVRIYAGLAPELFAGDSFALHGFMAAFYREHRYDGDVFRHRENFFARRNVTAIVLEVPTEMIGRGRVHAWATVSLFGHAPEKQVSRWGLPLVTHLFLNDPDNQESKETFNTSSPSGDVANFSKPIRDFAAKMSGYAGSVVNPAEYGEQVAQRLCPTMLPYELGTPAAFDLSGFNGRALGDDAMDVMLTLASNKPLADGVAPDRSRTSTEFPYYAKPYTRDEQAGVIPVPRAPTTKQ
jgi:Domain of unknown function (DUF4331)